MVVFWVLCILGMTDTLGSAWGAIMSLHLVLVCQYKICVRAFAQLVWGLFIFLYEIGT